MKCKKPHCRSGRRNEAVAVTSKAGVRGGVPVCATCVTADAERRDGGDERVQILWLLG